MSDLLRINTTVKFAENTSNPPTFTAPTVMIAQSNTVTPAAAQLIRAYVQTGQTTTVTSAVACANALVCADDPAGPAVSVTASNFIGSTQPFSNKVGGGGMNIPVTYSALNGTVATITLSLALLNSNSGWVTVIFW